MTLEELRARVPELNEYLKYMPSELNDRYWIHTYPAGTIIHQKDELLEYFGIVCEGSHRVINEFENRNIYMIERNDPIDFVGEVTILAEKPRTSVTIETLTARSFISPERILKTGSQKTFIFSALFPGKLRTSCTVPLTTGAASSFIRPSICCLTILSNISPKNIRPPE